MGAPGELDRLHGRVVAGTFVPHPWFANAHLQTLLPVLRPMPPIGLRIERRELPDGDFVDIGWCEAGRASEAVSRERPGALSQGPRGAPLEEPVPSPRSGPLAVLLHGLSGGFQSKYARATARRLLAAGWRAIILQFRGAGPEPNRLPRTYHHGDTEDLRELLQLLRAREPATPLYAVGWSLGGNVLLKYLGEEGDRTPLTGAAAVCPPFQLMPCAERLRTGFSRVYQAHLLRELKGMVRRKFERMPMNIDLQQALAARDFIEFDDAVTATINGFRDARDYYARCECGPFLRRIARDTLIVHSKDDPFMSPAIVPPATALAPTVTLELCDHGGHVGFVEAGPRMAPAFWLERRISDFLTQHAQR